MSKTFPISDPVLGYILYESHSQQEAEDYYLTVLADQAVDARYMDQLKAELAEEKVIVAEHKDTINGLLQELAKWRPKAEQLQAETERLKAELAHCYNTG